MATESKDKVITVELAGSIADAEKTYIDKVKTDLENLKNTVDDLPTEDDLLVAATSTDIESIISKFSVTA